MCSGITLPIGFLIVKSCRDTIAEEIIESARMYGVDFHRVFFGFRAAGHSMPGHGAHFRIITAWNEPRYASLLSQDSRPQTVRAGMRNFLSSYSANYPQAFAATVMANASAIIAYAFLSNRVITGHDRRDPQVNS